MKILGIETSCDETAAAVVELHEAGPGAKLLSNVVFSSMDLHAAYGGVVPEIAARSHIEAIMPVINQALTEAFGQSGERGKKKGVREPSPAPYSLLPAPLFNPWGQIDGIAVTYGAGLGGSLLIGVLTARTLAIIKKKPLYAINHVEGHIYANFLTEIGSSDKLQGSRYKLPAQQPEFPMLGLIVSGGHSQLVLWRGHFDYTLLGQTHDDAIGEAFDKVAKILGLRYPGGPSIGEAAKKGNPLAFNFPKAKLTHSSPALAELRRTETGARRKKNQSNTLLPPYSLLPAPRSASYDFSFSGLKTAVLRTAQELAGKSHEFPSHGLSALLKPAQKRDIAASFQRVAIETVVDKTISAFEEFSPKTVVIGGGVASSPELRRQLAERLPLPIEYPDPKLCTDNGAMIATLGCYKVILKQPTADPYSLEIAPSLSM